MSLDLELALVPHLQRTESMSLALSQGVRSEWLYDRAVRLMFESAMAYYVDSGMKMAATEDILRHELQESGDEALRNWWSTHTVPQEEVLSSYLIDELRTRYRRNQHQDHIRQIAALSVKSPDEALVADVTGASRILFDTTTLDRVEDYSLRYSSRVDQYFEDVYTEGEQFRAGRGFLVGWEEITEEIWGLKPTEFAVLGAPPAVGKSWFCCHAALAAALTGVRVYFPSLENSKEMTMMRLDCCLTGIPFEAYERRQLSREQQAQLRQGRELIKSLDEGGLLKVDHPQRSMERTVFEIYARARYEDCQLVIGDQLSWLTSRDSYRGEESMQMAEIVTDISDLTKEYSLASLWASQFTREGAARGRGRMNEFASTRRIEQTVDFAFSMSADREMRSMEMMLVEILKARRTRPKAWLLDWKLTRETAFRVLREYRVEEEKD